MAVADIDSVDETFQLTTSRRGRRHWYNHSGIRLNISTHDLTKRSTGMPEQVLDCSKHFNSRPHEEVDSNSQYLCVLTYIFQLTTSRRGRPAEGYAKKNIQKFQLTTSRRGRPVTGLTRMMMNTFQLTTSRRGRQKCIMMDTITIHYFNSRPHEEVDDSTVDNAKDKYISTHDLTKRSTEDIAKLDTRATFQLTTSRRGRLTLSVLETVILLFQLTTSRRGRQHCLVSLS